MTSMDFVNPVTKTTVPISSNPRPQQMQGVGPYSGAG